jgi:hypothetical protein
MLSLIREELVKSRQKEIDKLSTINDSINTAEGKIINQIQAQIDEDRQQRSLDEQTKNLQDLQSQRAYLAMDTSGANALDILNLDQQIKDET